MGYALHRIAIALLVVGFSMIPGLVVLHFLGLLAGSSSPPVAQSSLRPKWPGASDLDDD